MSDRTSEELLDLPTSVVEAMKTDLSYRSYLELCIIIMEGVQKVEVDNYQSDLFQDRAKAIENYRKWSKKPRM